MRLGRLTELRIARPIPAPLCDPTLSRYSVRTRTLAASLYEGHPLTQLRTQLRQTFRLKLRSLLIAFVVAVAASSTLHAQGALYLNPIAFRISNSTKDPGQFSFLGPNSTSRMFYGVVFGGYYDLPLQEKALQVSFDMRDSIVHGNSASLNTFLVGIRISPTKYGRYHPYIEPFIGDGSSRAPHTSVHVNGAQYGGFLGLDFDLNRHVQWRTLELSYSGLRTASGDTIGGTESIPSAGLLGITTGFVFRIP